FSAGDSGRLFGLRFDTPLTLKDTPLFGGLLTHISVDRFAVVCAGATVVNPILPSRDGPVALAGTFEAGISFAFTLASGDSRQPFVFALSSPAAKALLADAAPAGLTKWISVQKSFGPLAVQRVGLGWNDGRLSLMLDAAVTIAVLTIALEGFSVSLPVSAITNPSLDGVKVG